MANTFAVGGGGGGRGRSPPPILFMSPPPPLLPFFVVLFLFSFFLQNVVPFLCWFVTNTFAVVICLCLLSPLWSGLTLPPPPVEWIDSLSLSSPSPLLNGTGGAGGGIPHTERGHSPHRGGGRGGGGYELLTPAHPHTNTRAHPCQTRSRPRSRPLDIPAKPRL